MADTNTPNVGLLLPDTGDTFNFPLHVSNNFSTVDSMLGAVDCTSTTRPSNTYKGQIVYEHDSGRYVQNTGSKASPVWTYMSHAAMSTTSGTHPTSGLSTGLTIYETDTKFVQVYNGSSFEQKAYANYVCTSSAHPATTFSGMEIFETDTTLSATYNGSAFTYQAQQIAPTQTLSSTTASVTFTGIGSKFTNLSVFWSGRDTSGNLSDQLLLQFNGDTAAHYGYQYAQGQGSTASASSLAIGGSTYIVAGNITGGGATAGYYGGGRFDVLGWNKSASGRNAVVSGTGFVIGSNTTTGVIEGVFGGTYTPSAQLTSFTLTPASGSFAAGTQVSVYAHI